MKHILLTSLLLVVTNTASAGLAGIVTKALTHSADDAAEAGIRGSKRLVDDLHAPKTESKLVPDSNVSKDTLNDTWNTVTSRDLSLGYIESPPRSLFNQTQNTPEFPRFVRWWGIQQVDNVARLINDFERSIENQKESADDPQPITAERSLNPDSLFNPIIKETLALEDNSDYATNLADVFDIILLSGRYMGLDPFDTLAKEKLDDLEASDYLYLDTSLMAMLKARDQEPEKFADHLNKSAEIFFTSEYAEILRPYGCLALLNTSGMTRWYIQHGSEEIFKKYCTYDATMDSASRLNKLIPEDLQMTYANPEEMKQFFGIKSMQIVAPMVFKDESSYYEFRNQILKDVQQLDISQHHEIVLSVVSLLASAEIRFGNYRNSYDLARLVFVESLKHESKENIPTSVFIMGESLLKSKDYAGAFEMAKILEKLSNRNSEYFIPAENKIQLAGYLVALEQLWNESI